MSAAYVILTPLGSFYRTGAGNSRGAINGRLGIAARKTHTVKKIKVRELVLANQIDNLSGGRTQHNNEA